jgi:hypothetical protein
MRQIFLMLLFVLSGTIVFGQSIELSPSFGYTFNGSIDAPYGDYDLRDAESYGGYLGIGVGVSSFIELSYRRNNVRVDASTLLDGAYRFNAAVEHYHIGGLQEFSKGKIKPFALLSMGASRYFEKETSNSLETWIFSTSVGVGGKIFFSENIGLRLQTTLTLPMHFDGIGIFCGSGGGCGSSVYFGIPIVHFELSAGLVFKFNN